MYICALLTCDDAHASGLEGVAKKKQKPKREEEQDRDKPWHVLPPSLQNTKYKTYRKELEEAIE